MSRIAATIDLSLPAPQKPTSLLAALARPVHITEEQARDPAIVARVIAGVQQELADTTQESRSTFQLELIVRNVACAVGAAKVVVAHGFGRYAYCQVIRWSGPSTITAPVLVDDRDDTSNVLTDKNTIALRSYVAGTADLRIFA